MTIKSTPTQTVYQEGERRFVRFTGTELPIDLMAVEEKYNAQFVGDFCIKDRNGNYTTNVAAVFWQPTPPAPHTNEYFALFIQQGSLYIADGTSAVEKPIDAIIAANGEIVYSRHRHDYRVSSDGSVTVDGGRDYMRLVGDRSLTAPRVQLVVDGPRIEIKDAE